MTKLVSSLVLALLALAALSQGCFAEPFDYPPKRVAWIVGQGFAGSSGYPWPGPPWSWPIPTPKYGCYVFSQRLAGVWRRVAICQ